tara:strand:- start:621 stop:1274 length:654 start_codon:yes stop_codon:yes gene_type:complete
MWDGYKFGRPGLYVEYINHFTDWVADSWTATEVGTSLQDIEDIANGVLRLTSGGTENNGTQIQLGGTGDTETTGESFAPVAGKNLFLETRFKMNDVTQQDMFIGFHVQDTTIIAGRGSDYIGFRSDDGDALLDVESSASSSASDQASVNTMSDASWVKAGFKVTGTDKAEFYVDDALVATISTDIPTALMRLSICQLTGENAANELDIDYIFVAQEV